MAMTGNRAKQTGRVRKVKDYGKLSTEEFCNELKEWRQDPDFIRNVDKFIKKCLD